MPKRNDISKILLVGAGPIVIGQACEFDYSGAQACKALREEGYEVVLVNSNPATIMTDPEFADHTYIEPLTVEALTAIIRRERPDAMLPTMGGQTALNLAVALDEAGVLSRYRVELIGARADVIRKAEDRGLFKAAMAEAGLAVPRSGSAHSLEEARALREEIGSWPVVVRPGFTLGGAGGGIAHGPEELESIVTAGLALSPVHEVLIEESLLGWKEFEMEVMRDRRDQACIVCSIENVDPMGVHTGDSLTVAPAQTLTDREWQWMRDASLKVMRAIGVETGGANVQFAQNPRDGRWVVIEMNPRVSRSSALASKATGFPIARVAAKLAVGYTLDELPNDITRTTKACFEPSLDYVVVKAPRFAFEKFPGADDTLGTRMKSVGETMALGGTFAQALQKAMRSLETGRSGFSGKAGAPEAALSDAELERETVRPNPNRWFCVREALRRGRTAEELAELTGIDAWFLRQMEGLVSFERQLESLGGQEHFQKKDGRPSGGPGSVRAESKEFDRDVPDTRHAHGRDKARPSPRGCDNFKTALAALEAERGLFARAKELGFSDRQLAAALGCTESDVRAARGRLDLHPAYAVVDTCAAEFAAATPYYFSAWGPAAADPAGEPPPPRTPGRKRYMVLGGGPNRIGQGIEFDYCCVHACRALRAAGHETVMVNSNPETVSTDHDSSDRLYFEPVTLEDVLEIQRREQCDGVIVQFGGQTPLNLAADLKAAGVPILGTSPEDIDRAEDRDQFRSLCEKIGVRQPRNGIARRLEEAQAVASGIGYPVLVRPSFVLGGRAMAIVFSEGFFTQYCTEAFAASEGRPVLIDQFLENAIELDVDCLCDGERVTIGGIMEHVEKAGIHSGDSACFLPPRSLSPEMLDRIRATTREFALALHVRGLMNVQYAVQDGELYMIEVNPRASRTVPFAGKATGVPLAALAARVMAGESLADVGFEREVVLRHCAVKEAVLPFARFTGCRMQLTPEMHSTGEVMGLDLEPGPAFAKSQQAAGNPLPLAGGVFVSVSSECADDREGAIACAREMAESGYVLYATRETATALRDAGIPALAAFAVSEGRPNAIDLMADGTVGWIVDLPSGCLPLLDDVAVRTEAICRDVPMTTTLRGWRAALEALRAQREHPELEVMSLQEYHRATARRNERSL